MKISFFINFHKIKSKDKGFRISRSKIEYMQYGFYKREYGANIKR